MRSFAWSLCPLHLCMCCFEQHELFPPFLVVLSNFANILVCSSWLLSLAAASPRPRRSSPSWRKATPWLLLPGCPRKMWRSFKSVNKLPAMDGLVPQVPYGSIKMLQAMRKWVVECNCLKIPVVHNSFTLAEMDRMLDQMDFEAQLKVNKT